MNRSQHTLRSTQRTNDRMINGIYESMHWSAHKCVRTNVFVFFFQDRLIDTDYVDDQLTKTDPVFCINNVIRRVFERSTLAICGVFFCIFCSLIARKMCTFIRLQRKCLIHRRYFDRKRYFCFCFCFDCVHYFYSNNYSKQKKLTSK